MNHVEQVITARKAEFNQAMTANQTAQNPEAFQSALEQQSMETAEKTSPSSNKATSLDQQMAYAQSVYEAILAQGTTTATPAVSQPVKTTAASISSSPQAVSSTHDGKYATEIAAASKKYDVPESLIRKVIEVESNFNPNAVSSAGATGLMQLMYGENRLDPAANIDAGVKQLSGYIKNYKGDLSLALAAYNAGPGNVRKYGGIPPFTETQNYIKKILGKDVD